MKQLYFITFISLFLSVNVSAQITEVTAGFSFPYALALNENEMFISNTGGTKISKIDITATNPNVSDVVTGESGVLGMAIIGNYLYFSSFSDHKISKVDITSSTPIVTEVVTGLDRPLGLAFKGNDLYIAEYGAGKISKITDITAATPTVTDLVTGLNQPVKLAFKANELYFSSEAEGGIFKIDDVTSETPAVSEVATGLINPVGIAFNLNDLYIAEPKNSAEPDKIYKIDVTDDSATLTEVLTGLSGPRGIVFNGDVLYIAEGPAGKISKFDINSIISIPDPNFEQALIDLEIDTNGFTGDILRVDAENATQLLLNFPLLPNGDVNPFADPRVTITEKIHDLTGIEAFVNLTLLGVGYNELTAIDLSNNTKLDDLFLNDNLLTSIDISKNTLLKRFGVMRNSGMTGLDVSNNLLLEELFVDNTAMTSIDVSTNINLWKFYGRWSNLIGIDLSKNNNLRDVRVRGSATLNYMNVKNGNNSNMTGFDVRDMPSLSCITADGISVPEVSQLMLDFSAGLLSFDCGTVYIPDENFEQALIDLGIDSDGAVNQSLLKSDAENATQLNARFPLLPDGRVNRFADSRVTITQEITDLTGIEAFVNLDLLAVEFNALTSIDVSNNTKLKDLIIAGNSISTLDLTTNALLEYLNCNNNPIINLDVSQNTNLDELSIDNLQITEIDLSQNLLLQAFYASNLSNLTQIDFSENTALTNVLITGSSLETLDLSNNPAASFIYLNDNLQLVHLDIRNTNNTNIFYFTATNTPSLTCINVDYDTADHSGWSVDAGITFSEDCGDFVYIPDPNFEQALIDLEIDSDGVVNQSLLRSDAEAVTGINVNNKNINSLSGIEAFVNLKTLGCQDNQITSFDISNNVNLEALDCSGINNQFGSLNLSKNTKLKSVISVFNGLSSVDVSDSPDLKTLILQSNQLTSLDVSKNSSLELLICNSNQISSLDLSNNPFLTSIIVGDNLPLTSMDLRNGNNNNVGGFYVSNTPNLTCINADASISQAMIDSGKTFSEDCGDFVYIPDPNFEQALIDLEIDSDGVVNQSILRSDAENTTELNARFPTTPWGGVNSFADERLTITEKIQDLTGIEAFINLSLLALEFNALTAIDVSNNTKLKDLIIGGNSISTLDLTANALLEYLNCNFNPIASLDVSLNPNIRELSLDNLLITDIDLSNNLKLESFWASNMNDLTKIDFSVNTLLRNVLINGSKLEALDLSNNASLSLLFVNNNQMLAHLDLRNGNNANLFNFNVANNPILGCINADPIISQSMMSSGETFSEDCGDFVYIPDHNFEQSLIDIGVDTDGVVNTSILREDAETITSLNLNNSLFTPEGYGFNNPDIVNVSGKISDLTGIEAFVNLTNLQVSYSELETVNVSANVLLEELWITDGILTGIDVTANTNLVRLGVMRNNITGTVDVSQNTLLEWLFIYYNSINTIDLSNNPNLWNLWVNNNALTSLDISLNLNLQRLDVQYNPGLNLITNPAGYTSLTSANLSGIGLANYNLYAPLFPNLQWLLLNDNNLTRFNGNNALLVENLFLNNNGIDKLDLSSNIALKQLRVNNNVLTELDLRNGNNIDLTTLTATGNLLTCISVDNPTEVLPYSSWNIDSGVILSANCSAEAEVVLIPDSNFEIALGEYDTNGLNGNILLSDAESITNLNVSNASIIDLTGIEAFVNLIELNVSDNLLDTINLIENVNLIDLDVSSNSLAELNVYSGKNLLTLNVSSNQFQTIDVSSFSNLTVFDSTSNPNLLCIGVNDPNTIPDAWTKDDWSAYSNNPDCIEPIIVAKNVVIYLDGNKGQATVDPRAFDDGSSDNVTTNANLIFNLEVTDFTCSNLGLNTIELEVMDEAGNSAFKTVNLYVEDIISPTVIANNPYTYDLNGMSAYTITAEDVVKSSSDNCSDPILSIDQSIFTSTGTFTVTLTAEDSSGNTAEDTIDITIEDSADGAGSAGLSFKRNLNLTVFPVPFTDVINIDFSKATDLNTVSVVLFDFNMNETSITFSPNAGNLKSSFTGSLQTGLYILQVTVGSETKTATIVKGGN